MWFWNAPLGGVFVANNLTLCSSNDNFTTSSNQISIDTSYSLSPVENRQYRLARLLFLSVISISYFKFLRGYDYILIDLLIVHYGTP